MKPAWALQFSVVSPLVALACQLDGRKAASALSAWSSARPMDNTGKPTKGFVWVGARETAGAALEAWIDLAARYAGALASTSVDGVFRVGRRTGVGKSRW